MGGNVVDCTPTRSFDRIDLSKLSALQVYRSKGPGGNYGGYMASRMMEKLEQEKRKRESDEKMEMMKRRKEMEGKENTPFLGRGMLPGEIIRLEENERLSKIHAVKEKLDRVNSTKSASVNTPVSIKKTGNAVFDSLLKASQNKEGDYKEATLKKQSCYAEKAAQDELRIIKEREELM